MTATTETIEASEASEPSDERANRVYSPEEIAEVGPRVRAQRTAQGLPPDYVTTPEALLPLTRSYNRLLAKRAKRSAAPGDFDALRVERRTATLDAA